MGRLRPPGLRGPRSLWFQGMTLLGRQAPALLADSLICVSSVVYL